MSRTLGRRAAPGVPPSDSIIMYTCVVIPATMPKHGYVAVHQAIRCHHATYYMHSHCACTLIEALTALPVQIYPNRWSRPSNHLEN